MIKLSRREVYLKIKDTVLAKIKWKVNMSNYPSSQPPKEKVCNLVNH